jgi:hypothetical protein
VRAADALEAARLEDRASGHGAALQGRMRTIPIAAPVKVVLSPSVSGDRTPESESDH